MGEGPDTFDLKKKKHTHTHTHKQMQIFSKTIEHDLIKHPTGGQNGTQTETDLLKSRPSYLLISENNIKGKFGHLPLSQALDEVQPTQP